MIPVNIQPEPKDFYKKVKKDGEAFLREVPHPTDKQWENKEYWRKAIPDLISAYNSICAYCAQWISHPTGTPTVDHYIPRFVDSSRAYDWDNFRLACLVLNSRKGKHQDVLDPFKVQRDWFIIDFDSYMILPNPVLSVDEKRQVQATLNRLGLNADEAFVTSRRQWYEGYREGEYEFTHLERRAPFIAYEVQRQGLYR